MIVGVGVDVVSVRRFTLALSRTPGRRSRLFTERELSALGPRPAGHRLAARFAAKEAVAKALGAPASLAWHDCEVLAEESGAPLIVTHASVAEAARFRGVTSWHVSLSHDGGVAIAYVVAEKQQ